VAIVDDQRVVVILLDALANTDIGIGGERGHGDHDQRRGSQQFQCHLALIVRTDAKS